LAGAAVDVVVVVVPVAGVVVVAGVLVLPNNPPPVLGVLTGSGALAAGVVPGVVPLRVIIYIV